MLTSMLMIPAVDLILSKGVISIQIVFKELNNSGIIRQKAGRR